MNAADIASHASPGIQFWNAGRDPERSRPGDRLAYPINGIPSEWTVDGHPDLPALLREAADLIEQHSQDPGTAVDVYCFLHEAQRVIPSAECWAVVKEYGVSDPDSPWYGKDAVWTGCLDRDQAEAIAAVVEAHYARRHPRGDRDRFVVEWRKVRPHMIERPDTTADEYVRRLG